MRFNKIYLEITNRCNLHCSFCSKSNRQKKEMTLHEFEIIIDKIKPYTKDVYLHVKGEPLLHSHLDQILDICDRNELNVRITTNGTLLKEKKDILLKHHIKQINISLHCENNKPNYFEEIFDCCSELSKKMIIIYRIWILSNLKFDKISTDIVEKIIEYYKLSPNIVGKIFNDKNIKIDNSIYIDKDNEFIWPNDTIKENNSNKYGTCLGTKTHIAILVDGTVVPCCLDSEGIINLGNIFNERIDDIIKKRIFIEMNNGFKNNKLVCDLCKKCSFCQRFK